MLEPPFDIISCSWPRPIEQRNNQWASEPEWDAPLMPMLPQLHCELINEELCWMINWRNMFRQGLRIGNPDMGGEMRDFHIVLHLRIKEGGILVFWDDDGSIIRKNGAIIHTDRHAHSLTRHEIEVLEGDLLDVAQWQFGWDWFWGARIIRSDGKTVSSAVDMLMPYLQLVQQRLQQPEGPPLKVYTHGRMPICTIVAIYSLILNGYVPSAVYLFGENDWNERARRLFATFLPFAQVVPVGQVLAQMRTLGGHRLAEMASHYWFVMKFCVGILYPPEVCSLMDDDVFVLERLDEALAASHEYDLVYAPDQELGGGYLDTWGRVFAHQGPLHTNRCSAWLYWVKNVFEPQRLALRALQVQPRMAAHLWEQGLIALAYANRHTLELPSQRYPFALFQGLPGGMTGYDYKLNPCGFKAIHFGGLWEKPSDGVALQLAPQILGRGQPVTS
ncbi:MAG TPA: hypothetical protein VFA10_09670 [Ktedonobacteraceae bacterium]|nr:hypothetical protein [Ktedonobacteraceae bacterium]